jgi:hypothetical protein
MGTQNITPASSGYRLHARVLRIDIFAARQRRADLTDTAKELKLSSTGAPRKLENRKIYQACTHLPSVGYAFALK